jgi:hypothetical protein
MILLRPQQSAPCGSYIAAMDQDRRNRPVIQPQMTFPMSEKPEIGFAAGAGRGGAAAG